MRLTPLALLEKDLVDKYLSWLKESGRHSKACMYCLSISDQSSSHRLARMELLH